MIVQIAILTGVFVLAGVIVGGTLQIEASRRGLLREHQLRAATRMLQAGTAFFTALERRARAVGLDPTNLTRPQQETWLADLRANVDAAREDARRLLEMLAPVELAFGEGSATARSAGAAVMQAHEMISILADEGRPRGEDFAATWDAAVESFGNFRGDAHRVFSRPVWRP